MKRICSLVLGMIMLLSPMMIFASFDEYESIPVWSNSVETLAQIQNKTELNIEAEAVVLMDEGTGTILYAKNEHTKLRPASVTKIMTILLTMEALKRGDIKLTDKVPCSERARKMGGSQIWLNETEELTVDEMLKAICVVSANDCSVAMAEFIGGSEEMFVQRMNERAKALGMNDTTFKNSHGIDEDGHLTSAYDIALMSRELSKNFPVIHDYTTIWMDTLRDGKSELVNTNKLVRFYSGCTGLKTGSTSIAGFNVSATATRNDLKLIAVVLHGTTSQSRFDDAKMLLDYGFANYTNKVIAHKGENVTEIEIKKSKNGICPVAAENDLIVLLNKGTEKSIRVENILNENINAPLEYYDIVGVQKCYLDDEEIGSVNLVVFEKVEKKNWGHFFTEMLDFGYNLGR